MGYPPSRYRRTRFRPFRGCPEVAKSISNPSHSPRTILQVCEDVSEGVAAGQQAVVATLCRHFSSLGWRVEVAGPVRRHTPVAAWLSPYVGWRTRQPLGLVGIRTLWAAVKRSHLVHIHGIWSPVGAIAALAAACNQIPYVLTPHGMLQPWLLRRGRR